MRTVRARLLVLAAGALLVSGCGPADTVTIQGCGATFPAPLYERWFLEFYKMHPNVRVNYQAIGSGAGVQQFEQGLVHCGASDESLKADKLKHIAKTLSDREHKTIDVLQIPMTAGAVAVCYNLPGDPPLKLTRKALVDIVLGQLTYWDDPRIQQANPGLNLPHLEISFIRRAEGSGTTFVFTSYLDRIDERWTKKKGGPGAGKTVQWPVNFIGGKGNAGVAALVQQTPGAIGYLEAGYAELTEMPMAALENKSGKFVLPTAAACRGALAQATLNDVLGVDHMPDPKEPGDYPIVTFTWIICRNKYAEPRVAEKLREVLSYCLEDKPGRGQALSDELGYVPLPEFILDAARKKVTQIAAE
jgi:phosphate transport system substrate-binding protein